MTAEELIGGLRERGYRIHRYTAPPTTLIACLYSDDPLLGWLQEIGAAVRHYPRTRETWVYEAKLNTVRVTDEDGPLAIWEAAAQ